MAKNYKKIQGKADDGKVGKMAVTAGGLKLMIAGLLVMVAGFILLAGGGSDDPQVFNYAMFDFRRLVAAPIVIVSGVLICVVSTWIVVGRLVRFDRDQLYAL